ncbi:type I-F CRISPR-associated endoribonuclease Cas6/Csy4 [Aliikangiella sp. IMCC44359]|uniref:type I-F CRISPR-associated endoribonuclease Cas6/Csy4 n=1 Tax=Aliikangiella sp. IMCC44359 TaxID=3459125 RepID=UPI00403ABBB7
MEHYIDIKLNPDAEMREAELTSKIYTKFHKALVTLKTDQVGISFPKVNFKLGLTFRIHGSQSLLNDLNGLGWLGSLKGACEEGDILEVPENIMYRCISSKRSNMSNAKLRRLIARGSLDEEGIKRYKQKMFSQGFDNPYLDLVSASRGQVYRKFFNFGEIRKDSQSGEFDSYGLSKTATVPWF